MPTPSNNKAMAYGRDLMDRALESEKGIRIGFPDKKAAIRTRFDCYNARKADQRSSKELFPEGDPNHGVSPYDVLRISLEEIEGRWYLLFEPHTIPPIADLEVEDL